MPNTEQSSGRRSPRSHDQKSGNESDNTQLELKQLIVHIKNQNDQIIANQKSFLERLDSNTEDIEHLKGENSELKSRIDLLNEKFVKLDQYSRKDVAILTGLSFDEKESQHELEETVVNIINKITGKTTTIRYYVAIHRNGRNIKGNGRPPSVTIKFLRFYDKGVLFMKNFIAKRKTLFRGINFHHCLSEGMIAVQNAIAANGSVKFVRYMGANRYFTVCIKRSGKDDIFLNRIESVKHFECEIDKLDLDNIEE